MNDTANNANRQPAPDLWALASRVCDGTLTPSEQTHLDALLQSEDARRCFGQYMLMHGELLWRSRGEIERAEEISIVAAPVFDVSGTPWQGVVSFFSQGLPFCYLIATLVVGLGLLLGSLVPVSSPVQVVQQPAPLPPSLSPLPTFVGRITGMVDCKWEKKGTDPIGAKHPQGRSGQWGLSPFSPVSIGDTFALSSGLMEITYDTGAKVLLQGPVTYEVESAAAGFLSVGKLTAKLEKKPNSPRPSDGRGAGGEGVANSPRPSDGRGAGGEGNSHPSSFILHPLFSVRTPTAIVTDLGTEFGVEVSKDGNTTSHVFRGSVRLQVTSSDGKAKGAASILHENESACVEINDDQGGVKRIVILDPSAKLTGFVRKIPKLSIKKLDLVDVVAGGDGFSGRRNGGIDPTTGRVTDKSGLDDFLAGSDGTYHRVESLPFVDGVFVPDSRSGGVQLDSAGHIFAGFSGNDNRTAGHFWAGGKITTAANIPTAMHGIDYSLPGRGFLFLHANKGITFDLDAIRRATGCRLGRFLAATGNTERVSTEDTPVFADVWVFVDGLIRFQRKGVHGRSGVFSVAVPIDKSERFLTLAATDGGNTIDWDWIIFGNPQLEMLSVETDTTQDAAEQ